MLSWYKCRFFTWMRIFDWCGTLTGSTLLSFVWPLLLLPIMRAWRLVIASSSSGDASFFACIARDRACVDFAFLSAGEL